jgi:acyl carrier protein
LSATDLLVERIRPMIMAIMPHGRAAAPLAADDLLASHGMDSMRLMMLITALQREFGVRVEEEDLVEDNFASLGAVAAFVAAKGGA